MGKRLENNFKKKFGNRKFVVIYPEKQLEGAERRFQNEQFAKAYIAVLAGVLGREPTTDEILGFKDISKEGAA